MALKWNHVTWSSTPHLLKFFRKTLIKMEIYWQFHAGFSCELHWWFLQVVLLDLLENLSVTLVFVRFLTDWQLQLIKSHGSRTQEAWPAFSRISKWIQAVSPSSVQWLTAKGSTGICPYGTDAKRRTRTHTFLALYLPLNDTKKPTAKGSNPHSARPDGPAPLLPASTRSISNPLFFL